MSRDWKSLETQSRMLRIWICVLVARWERYTGHPFRPLTTNTQRRERYFTLTQVDQCRFHHSAETDTLSHLLTMQLGSLVASSLQTRRQAPFSKPLRYSKTSQRRNS